MNAMWQLWILRFPKETCQSVVVHKVNPVTKGTRHSLVAWIEGPKWR